MTLPSVNAPIPYVQSCPHGESAGVRPRLLFLAGKDTTLFECCQPCVAQLEDLAGVLTYASHRLTLADCIEYGLVIRVKA